jgi:hypothetical protein
MRYIEIGDSAEEQKVEVGASMGGLTSLEGTALLSGFLGLAVSALAIYVSIKGTPSARRQKNSWRFMSLFFGLTGFGELLTGFGHIAVGEVG